MLSISEDPKHPSPTGPFCPSKRYSQNFPEKVTDRQTVRQLALGGDSQERDWALVQRGGHYVSHGDLLDLHFGHYQCHEPAAQFEQRLGTGLFEVFFSSLGFNSVDWNRTCALCVYSSNITFLVAGIDECVWQSFLVVPLWLLAFLAASSSSSSSSFLFVPSYVLHLYFTPWEGLWFDQGTVMEV